MRALLLLTVALLSSPSLAADLVGPVSDESVAPIILDLVQAEDDGRVDILIDSQGGDVSAGMMLINAIRAAKRRGVGVVCVVDGQASSMAAYLLQVCSVRVMLPGSFLLFHAPRTQAEGNSWEIQKRAKDMQDIERIFAILATGRMHVSVAEFEARIRDTDWVISPDEALELGAADL